MDREGGGTGKGKEGMSVRRRDRKERGRGGHKREPLISRLLSSIPRKVLLWQGGECLSMLMGSMERWNSWTGFFPESHRAKETSCFDPFIVDATFSARTGRDVWDSGKMANLIEMDSNDSTSRWFFSLFFFYGGFIFHQFLQIELYKKFLFIIIRRNIDLYNIIDFKSIIVDHFKIFSNFMLSRILDSNSS